MITQSEILEKMDELFVSDLEIGYTQFEFFSFAKSIQVSAGMFEDKKVLVSEASSIRLMLLVWAVLLGGGVPLLCAPESKIDHSLRLDWKREFEGFLQNKNPFSRPDIAAQIGHVFANSKENVIFFCTSGSSGNMQIYGKSWSNLVDEAIAIANVLDLPVQAVTLSFVSPRHIYGFLFSHLVPFLLGAKVFLDFNATEIVGNKLGEIFKKIDCVILVPALWNAVKQFLNLNISKFVTSGAPFGDFRELDFTDIRSQFERSIMFFEFLGSTETGGMGYREIGRGMSKNFTFLPGVSIIETSDTFWVKSSFVQGGSVLVADKFELDSGNNCFRYLGRMDRIVKYNGNRVSLTMVEEELRKITNCERVVCRFLSDDNYIKGGCITAYIERDTIDMVKLRSDFSIRDNCPFPNKIFFVDIFPLNSMGKFDLSSVI